MIEFSDQVLEAWRRARRLQRRGEDDGEAFRKLKLELHALLRLRPCDTSPLYAHDGKSPPSAGNDGCVDLAAGAEAPATA